MIICFLLLGIYNANWDYLPGDDPTASVFLPHAILNERSLTFTAEDYAFMFSWEVQGGLMQDPERIDVGGWLPGVLEWPQQENFGLDALSEPRELYYLVPTLREGEFASNFGIGAGLCLLPAVLIAEWINGAEELDSHGYWMLSKGVASACVAGSALFVFLIVSSVLDRASAWWITGAYGLGTCVWAISSQALWQHGPAELFLAAACYFLVRPNPERYFLVAGGLLLSLGVLCRPTLGIAVVVFAVWGLLQWKRRVGWMILGGIPILILLGVYHQVHFGSPWVFGQIERGATVALEKTGNSDPWAGSVAEGLAGLIFSPSRGLLVFSPFLVFGFYGAAKIWLHPEWKALRPVCITAILMMLVAGKWFDWWGGWTFGYRPIVDTAPLLCLLLIPAFHHLGILEDTTRFSLWTAMLTWAVGVQILGAWSYDLVSWNIDRGRNIDRLEYRSRLWLVRDNIIFYYLEDPVGFRREKWTRLGR